MKNVAASILMDSTRTAKFMKYLKYLRLLRDLFTDERAGTGSIGIHFPYYQSINMCVGLSKYQ